MLAHLETHPRHSAVAALALGAAACAAFIAAWYA